MRHFISHVLPEPQALRVDADLRQKELNASHKIPEGLVVYDFRLHCPANSYFADLRPAVNLVARRQKAKPHVAHFREAAMRLVLRVDEVFNFSHGELPEAEAITGASDKPEAEKALTRTSFVAECTADLGSSKWHPALVELEKLSEIEENALCSLRPEVELGGFAEDVSSLGVFNLKPRNHISKLLPAESVYPGQNSFVIALYVILQHPRFVPLPLFTFLRPVPSSLAVRLEPRPENRRHNVVGPRPRAYPPQGRNVGATQRRCWRAAHSLGDRSRRTRPSLQDPVETRAVNEVSLASAAAEKKGRGGPVGNCSFTSVDLERRLEEKPPVAPALTPERRSGVVPRAVSFGERRGTDGSGLRCAVRRRWCDEQRTGAGWCSPPPGWLAWRRRRPPASTPAAWDGSSRAGRARVQIPRPTGRRTCPRREREKGARVGGADSKQNPRQRKTARAQLHRPRQLPSLSDFIHVELSRTTQEDSKTLAQLSVQPCVPYIIGADHLMHACPGIVSCVAGNCANDSVGLHLGASFITTVPAYCAHQQSGRVELPGSVATGALQM
ncbi:MAG: hypothetical protein BJ554DRAFT_4697 [Olpidium bornovanus]|uniref:Uncharacterized protein n=1 Tax=Olpidium bornovanus TaxID=278681 RepID=A0A8H7ZLX2_9FUNG|nr:MAG: hypothetical protein BJ554DRAFT_4697 [Olpidium bornovanus]